MRIHYMNKEAISDDYVYKILEILETAKDISSTKLFIELIIKNYSDRIIKKVINLLKLFNWENLTNSLIDSMKPATFDNISNICSFTKV